MSVEFDRLLTIMDELREKCPWDRKQTFNTLSHLTVEEVYELYDAILDNDIENIKEEIGDIMLHLVFYAKLISEKDNTSIEDILKKGNEKLIRRHPHVYDRSENLTEKDVKVNWEKQKKREGRKSIFSGVPNSLPSVIKAYRIQDKAANVGFQWEKTVQVREKIEEEIHEMDEAVNNKSKVDIECEIGDVLFSIINYSRYFNVDPEIALQKTNKKFMDRFQYIENNAIKPLSDMTLDEMDELWNEAKLSQNSK